MEELNVSSYWKSQTSFIMCLRSHVWYSSWPAKPLVEASFRRSIGIVYGFRMTQLFIVQLIFYLCGQICVEDLLHHQRLGTNLWSDAYSQILCIMLLLTPYFPQVYKTISLGILTMRFLIWLSQLIKLAMTQLVDTTHLHVNFLPTSHQLGTLSGICKFFLELNCYCGVPVANVCILVWLVSN